MQKVIAGNYIDEAYCHGFCPHCGKNEPDEKGTKAGNWMDSHLSRCKMKRKDIDINIDVSTRWAGHEQYGWCMILSSRDGLVLVENANGRYIATASSLRLSRISEFVHMIKGQDLSRDEYLELLAFLAKEARVEDFPMSPIDNSNTIEFKHANKYVIAKVLKRHGVRRVIIKPCGNAPEMNIGIEDVTRVIE